MSGPSEPTQTPEPTSQASALAPVRRVAWPQSFRIIRSVFPPIDLFEDIADPLDWEALASAESKTNPRIWDVVGNLALVPAARRVSGPGSTLLMAPFVHCSPDRPGRFSDGTYGVYYAGETEEVALREVAHHHAAFMRATGQPPGWASQFRALLGHVDLDLHDVAGLPEPRRAEVLDPDTYCPGQALAATLRAGGSNGLVYPSVRTPRAREAGKGGRTEGRDCVAVFWPDLLPIPTQGDHHRLHFDGHAVDRVMNERTKAVFAF